MSDTEKKNINIEEEIDEQHEDKISDEDKAGDAVNASESEPEKKDEEVESERYIRLMAEFQNFKRRTADERKYIHAYANEKIALDLLPVMDNFERALETDCNDPDGYMKGMKLIFEQMKAALEKAGIKAIEAVGEEFNPTKHNAVMTEESSEYESGKVVKELQKGYTLNDKVIRPSMVSVAK